MVYADHPDLVITHKHYLNMISWAEHDPTAKIIPAIPCSMNIGRLTVTGQNSLPRHISMMLSCELSQDVIWS